MKDGKQLRICSLGDARSQAVQIRSRCFLKLGHRVRILSPDPVLLSDIVVMAPSAGRGTLLRRVRSYIQMACLLLRWRPDVVIVHFAAAPFNWLLPLLWYRPLVVSVMGGDILFEERKNWSPSRQRATLSLLEIADRVVSMSHHMLSQYPDLQAKALVSPWGIDMEQFAVRSARQFNRTSLGIPNDVKIIVSPRRPVPVCGIIKIVEAMALVTTRLPGAMLLLLNDKPNPEYRQQLLERIDQCGLRERVMWLNSVAYEQMPEIYRLADATVSVATSDGVSLSVLESMAARTPVVLGDIPNYIGIFEHRKHCLLVDPRDSGRIAEGIVDILTDKELGAALIEEAYHKVAQDGNLHTEARRVEEILLELDNASNRPLRLMSRVRHTVNLARVAFDRKKH